MGAEDGDGGPERSKIEKLTSGQVRAVIRRFKRLRKQDKLLEVKVDCRRFVGYGVGWPPDETDQTQVKEMVRPGLSKEKFNLSSITLRHKAIRGRYQIMTATLTCQ